jgi:hypothetical protein
MAKRKFPGPWRRTHRELNNAYTLSMIRGQIHIRTSYTCIYRRTINRYGEYAERRETESGPDLNYVLEKLHLSDRESNILMMMEGAIDLIEKLVKRHDFYLWRAERLDLERRKKAYAKKKAGWDARKAHNTRMQRVKNKQFGRNVEV